MAPPGRSTIQVALHGNLPEANVAGQDLFKDLPVKGASAAACLKKKKTIHWYLVERIDFKLRI